MRKPNTKNAKLKFDSTEEYQHFIDKILKIMPTIAQILKKDLETRDDDSILVVRVWEKQGAKNEFSFEKIKELLYLGKIASPETIGRARRYLQVKHVELRGKLYNKRHKQDIMLKNQIKMNFDI